MIDLLPGLFYGVLIGLWSGYNVYYRLFGWYDQRENQALRSKLSEISTLLERAMSVNRQLLQELKDAEAREDSADWWKKQ